MEKETYEILWEQTFLPIIEINFSSAAYEMNFKTLTPVDINGNKIVLISDSQMVVNSVNLLADKFRICLKSANTYIDDFIVYLAKDKEDYQNQMDVDTKSVLESHGSPINPKFTFESYVQGSSNEFVYAAAKAVAENPGDAYNPLFIYGGTGLGKTHILMAIANYLKKYKPTLNVLYATCEQFTNQMVEAVARGKALGSDFRKKYRNVDVLLIDDVQFLAKKQRTQEEFFNTFNELVMQNKQIVLTCDRPPKEIEVLEDRLRTRFEGGLLADVQVPDLETKVAILRRKSEEQKCVVDMKVLEYIAETFDDDIRTLIGKLTKVIFASKLHERPITIELVNSALKESTSEKQEELQADDIINCVSSFYKTPKSDMLGKKKNKEFVVPRQVCIYLICEMMNLPLVTVGQIMGGRDHATVIYARDKIAEQAKQDVKLSVALNDIKKMLLKQ